MKRVCIFCGSSMGTGPQFRQAAEALGGAVARRGLGMVYGGGNIGLMGVVADAALEAGAEVIGVIPQALVDKELAHRGLTDLHIVNSMHERKALMAELVGGFIALPGGFGTLEELCEILTWSQLGLHQKPCALLNTAGFYIPFLTHLAHAISSGFIREQHRDLLLVDDNPDSVVERLLHYKPPVLPKWIGLEET